MKQTIVKIFAADGRQYGELALRGFWKPESVKNWLAQTRWAGYTSARITHFEVYAAFDGGLMVNGFSIHKQ